MAAFIASLGLAYAGYAAVCITMHRQAQTFWIKLPAHSVFAMLRTMGFLLIAFSSLPWIRQSGFAMGFVSWLFCILPLAPLPLIFLWPYRPKIAILCAVAAVPLSVLLFIA